MATTITGGCRCGQLRYSFEQEGPLLNYCCHCLDCQKSTASAFADQIIVATDALVLTGRAVTFSTERPSGGTKIGRAHVWTPVPNAHLVCRLLLEKKKTHPIN